MELKRAEVEFEKTKHEQQVKQQANLFEQQSDMMEQQQQQQMQAMQMIMLQQQQQQSQALIALLDKLSK